MKHKDIISMLTSNKNARCYDNNGH